MHPAEGPTYESGTRHQVTFMCDDIKATVADLRARGVQIDGEPKDEGWGITVMMTLPGNAKVMLYQPRHPVAITRNIPVDPLTAERSVHFCTARCRFRPRSFDVFMKETKDDAIHGDGQGDEGIGSGRDAERTAPDRDDALQRRAGEGRACSWPARGCTRARRASGCASPARSGRSSMARSRRRRSWWRASG